MGPAGVSGKLITMNIVMRSHSGIILRVKRAERLPKNEKWDHVHDSRDTAKWCARPSPPQVRAIGIRERLGAVVGFRALS